MDDFNASSAFLSYDRRLIIGRWNLRDRPVEPLTERPAITGARAMMSLVPGWNNLLVECMDGLHCCPLPPPTLDERPLMERGTHLRRGGGRPPEVRRPSGPKEEEFLRPPSIVVFIYFFRMSWAVILDIVVRSPSSSWAKQVL